MPTYSYIPVQYWQKFKRRLWRLFGSKNYKGRREEILARVAIRHGMIRHERFNKALNRLLKEVYKDSIEDIMCSGSKFLKDIK